MTNILIMFIVFMALLFLGIPVVFALGTASLIWLLTMNPVGIPASVAAQTMMSQMLSFALIAMPGFLFVGRMMNTSGVTDRLLKFSVAVVGRYRGGLAHANALASMLFASMSGNAVADAGGLGLVEMDMMTKAGYKRDFSAGIDGRLKYPGADYPAERHYGPGGFHLLDLVASLFYRGIIPGILLTGAMMGFIAYVRF